jgi:hypothetical protein
MLCDNAAADLVIHDERVSRTPDVRCHGALEVAHPVLAFTTHSILQVDDAVFIIKYLQARGEYL